MRLLIPECGLNGPGLVVGFAVRTYLLANFQRSPVSFIPPPSQAVSPLIDSQFIFTSSFALWFRWFRTQYAWLALNLINKMCCIGMLPLLLVRRDSRLWGSALVGHPSFTFYAYFNCAQIQTEPDTESATDSFPAASTQHFPPRRKPTMDHE